MTLIMKATIRISTDPHDIESVLEVVQSFSGSAEELKNVRDWVSIEFTELGDNRILFILSNDVGVIATSQLILKKADNDDDLANGVDAAHIHALQVKKEYQRQGHASRLMQEVEEYARETGITTLTLGVDGDNPPALKLYDKLGYTLLKEREGRTSKVKLFYLKKSINKDNSFS